MESSKNNQTMKKSLTPCLSSQVLWSGDKPTKETTPDQSLMGVENTVNVQVILRCRPINEEEEKLNTSVAISCDSQKREVFVVKPDKSFMFDGVFGPESLQKDLFDQVVVPIIDDALEGYICTILAYGQSGTGKTYTMEGELRNIHTNGAFDDGVGVIPRAVRYIFDVLKIQNVEYIMRVAYLELYNEEIADLLVDENSKKLIKIMEDGKGNLFLRGLQEFEVKTADDVFKILYEGAMKKHTAETLLSERSNRSHSIFSISIHVKGCLQDGVELLKFGKINFVDLAGSENIQRSSAREAGMINKSLLTFGRVINALLDNSNHVPYRDSKLTRLLRDSLGGRTKTCLIATISPSISCLEESVNTLEYANCAKNIKNRPEVNQKVLRSTFKDLYEEINHLRRELQVTREKNGIYIPEEQYMKEQDSMKAMLERVKRIELDLGLKEEKAKEIQELFLNQKILSSELCERYEKTQRDLERTEKALAEVEENHRKTNQIIKEKDYLIYNLLGSEKALTETAFQLRTELDNAASEMSSLLQDIDSKNKKEGANGVVIQKFRSQLISQLQVLHKIVSDSVMKQEEQLKAIEDDALLFFSEKSKATDQLKARVEELKAVYHAGMKRSEDLVEGINENLQSAYDSLKTEIPKQSKSLMDSFRNFAFEADVVIDDLQNKLIAQKEKLALFLKQQQEAHSVISRTTQSISISLFDFFYGSSIHIPNLELLSQELQNVEEDLYSFENKLEEYAANEKKEILEKFLDILASSKGRRKIMEQNLIGGLKGIIAQKSKKLDYETMKMKELTTSTEQIWTTYVENMGTQYIENSIIVDLARDELEEGLKHCKEDTNKLPEQWRDAEQCLQCLQKINVDSIDSIIKEELKANQTAKSRASSNALSTCNEINATIDGLANIGLNDPSKKFNLSVSFYRENLRQMESSHFKGSNEIIRNSEKCRINEYKIDESSYVETKRQKLDLPSSKAIEELKTPPFEELLKSFHEDKFSKNLLRDVTNPIIQSGDGTLV